MENSILTSTKKLLGIIESYTVFDPDIITYINSVFSTLNQFGIGPDEGFIIEDNEKQWSDLGLPEKELSMVRAYMVLKVRMMFDPPGTSYLIEAANNQIKEHEYRLTYFREGYVET